MLRFWQSLRGKLILTYTLVTVLALLSLEFLIMLAFMTLSSFTNVELRPYLQDVLYVLPPQARIYLMPGRQDISGLQSWLEQTYDLGKASLDAQGIGDSPAALIVKANPLYVLSPEGIVLAQFPLGNNSLVGRKYSPPDLPGSQAVLDRAFSKKLDPSQLSLRTSGGNYWIAVPILEEASSPALLGVNGQESGRKLFGVIVVTVKPPPPLLWRFWPFLLGGVLLTGFILLLAVAPLGALFGFIMSRGLTRRLTALTLAADAWSEGDFSIQPKDRSRDEISYLGMRLRHMAERVQALLQTQHELAMLEERNRLARELHDTVKQQTFATLMQVRAAKNLLERDPLAANRHLEEAESLIKTSQHELGMMISELRPAALEGQGLVEALRGYLDSWQQHSLIPSDFQVQNERRLPLAVEQALYRVAQEALSNVARHSRASQVTVRLEFSPAQVCLIVMDNGVGFSQEQNAGNGSYGLQSMRERLAALGGMLTIESSDEQGAKLAALVPIGKE